MKSTIHSRSDRNSFDGEVMNIRDALKRLGDDEELLRDIVQIYLEDAPGMVQRMHQAVEQADANSLQQAAHSRKGLAATLSAADVVGAAAHLEHIAATRNLVEAPQGVADVDQRVAELNDAAKRFLRPK
jgi:two-component system, sensor histidine kinase and response regulator